MKPLIKISSITVTILFLVFQIVSAEEATIADTAVGVGQLMSNADQYTDNIIVLGVVSKVFSQDNLIGLIDADGANLKKCTKPCNKTSAEKCPMKVEKDNASQCPMAVTSDNTRKCPMAAAWKTVKAWFISEDNACDKSCAKTCSMASEKNCPKASGTECTRACDKTESKKCLLKQEKDRTKACPMADAKNSGKTCGDKAFTLTLPVQWAGDMPEISTEVLVAGKITRKDGRLLFVAESIKNVSN